MIDINSALRGQRDYLISLRRDFHRLQRPHRALQTCMAVLQSWNGQILRRH